MTPEVRELMIRVRDANLFLRSPVHAPYRGPTLIPGKGASVQNSGILSCGSSGPCSCALQIRKRTSSAPSGAPFKDVFWPFGGTSSIYLCVWGGRCRYSKDLTLHFMGTSVHSPKVALPQPRPAKGTESRAGDQGWGVTQAHQTRPWWPRGGGRRSPVTRDGVSSVSLRARARQPSCALVPAGFTHRIITAGITHNCQERLGHRKTVSYNCPFALHQ